MGVIALAAGVALVVFAATCLAAILRIRGIVAFALAVTLLAFGEVVALSYVLSVVHCYERRWLLTAFALVAAGSAALARVADTCWPSLRVGRASRSLATDRVLTALAVVVVVELGYVVALALGTPPTERDALSYHVMRALFWIQQGTIGYIADASDQRLNEFPVNTEILQGATMLLSGSARWVAVVQLVALPVAVLAIYGMARRIGLDTRQAAFGALLFATLPVVVLQASTALNDLVTAALVATASFFLLGRSRAEIGLACLAVALLVGTKGTALVALPVLVMLAVVAQRGWRLALALAGVAIGVLVGSGWYLVNLDETGHFFGTLGEVHQGNTDGLLAIAARATHYGVEAVDLPGALGGDRFLYVGAAAIVAISGIVLRRRSIGAIGFILALFPLLVLPLRHLLQSIYWHGWHLLGYDEAHEFGLVKDPTVASNVQSWYGPVGLAGAVLAIVLVTRLVRRHQLPPTALMLAAAPVLFIVGVAYAVAYIDLNGRFVMGGVALSAATWGVIQPLRAVAVAFTAIAATTSLLTLDHYSEKPSGVDLIHETGRPSIWTLPREWAQSIEPEIAKTIGYADDHVPDGAPIAVARKAPYPFAYAGYPRFEHRIVYADTPEEASRKGVDWAVLLLSDARSANWHVAFRSPPWGIYHRQASGHTFRRAPGSVTARSAY